MKLKIYFLIFIICLTGFSIRIISELEYIENVILLKNSLLFTDSPIGFSFLQIFSSIFEYKLANIISVEITIVIISIVIFYYTKNFLSLMLFQFNPLTHIIVNSIGITDDFLSFLFLFLLIVSIEKKNKKRSHLYLILLLLSHKTASIISIPYLIMKKEYKLIIQLVIIISIGIYFNMLEYYQKITQLIIHKNMLFEPFFIFYPSYYLDNFGWITIIYIYILSLLIIFLPKKDNKLVILMLITLFFPFNSTDQSLIWRLLYPSIVIIPLLYKKIQYF